MKTIIIRCLRLFAWGAFILLLTGSFQEDNIRYEKIRQTLSYFTLNYPQQKVYLHTDKDAYKGGDVIWMKAYLVAGINHIPDSLSTNLYVELIDPAKNVIQTRRFRMYSGFGAGDITLSDTLAEGLYQIRAYTNWMQNFNVDYFFIKNFQLENPNYTNIISPKQARINTRKIEKKTDLDRNFDIQFLPEGGNMVYGMESVIAFKAINKLGFGIDVSGEIYDNKNRKVTSFGSLHRGMGTFVLTPEKNLKYYALVVYEGEKARVPLPAPYDAGTIMHVHDTKETIEVILRTNRNITASEASEVLLTGQVRGVIYFHSEMRFEKNEISMLIDKSIFPTGIVQLTLFSGRGEPLAERLVFVDHDDEMKVAFRASDVYTDDGAKVRLDIRVTDQNNKPLKSNLSLSVVKQAADTAASAGQIVSYMLLASDLTGYVEDPSYYFKDDPAAVVSLDNLMLTQGWRRFDWKDILAGVYPELNYFEEKGIAINGRIVHDFFDIPLKGCLVRLTIMDEYNDVFTQYSGDGGYFNFDGLYYTDTVSIKIEAWRKSGRRNLVITVPESIPQEVRQFYGDYNLTTVSERDNKQYRIRKAKEYNEAMLKAQKELEDPDNNRLTGIHNPPQDILTSDEIPSGTRNIFEALTGRIPGVMVTGDNILIRGPSTLYGKTQPLFLVDNLPVEDINSIKAIPIETIDRIEVLKGSEAAIYGVRGSNGVIAIYTKRGKFMLRGVMEYDILGYNLPKTFYQPEYTPQTEPAYDYTLVWIPYIQTNESGTAQVMFDKPVTGGEYRFVIEGVSYNGQVGHSEATIENLD